MRILVINSGSSSIKFSIFDVSQDGEPENIFDGSLIGIGSRNASLHVTFEGTEQSPIAMEAATAGRAIATIFDKVCSAEVPQVDAIGYRVVHAGPKLDRHQRITTEVLEDLRQARSFAPLHEPEAVAVIQEGMRRLPNLPHFACFDTVFHQTMPEEATTYPLPAVSRKGGVRRYGFHGLSCESIVRQLRLSGDPLPKRMVLVHLGSGCSVTAVVEGLSIDTSMGLTPTGGVVMGTRPGDLDPGMVLYLLRQQDGTKEEAIAHVESIMNHSSGIAALSGMPNDFKAVRAAAVGGSRAAILALKVFTRSITKAIGSYAWLMGGVDAVVFAGGIGENDALTRLDILAPMHDAGVRIDPDLNQYIHIRGTIISSTDSSASVHVVPAQEDLMIALHVERLNRLDPMCQRT